jgi:hypothetical protein
MTHEDYERRKQRLDEQLRAGIELLESAHRAQVRALDLVWMLQSEEQGQAPSPAAPTAGAAPAKREPAALPETSRRRSPAEVARDVGKRFHGLPESFSRVDVCEALGYKPNRGALFRILQELVRQGHLVVEAQGGGNRATVYRKTGRSATSAAG